MGQAGKAAIQGIENTISLHGEVRAIAGAGVREIEALEIEEVNSLSETI
jgi:hypothetical protein